MKITVQSNGKKMKTNRNLWGSLIICFFLFQIATACGSGKENKTPEEKIVGEWKSIYLKVSIKTFNGESGGKIEEITEANWEEKTRRTPVFTTVNKDKTMQWRFVSKKSMSMDSLVMGPLQSWSIKGDSLFTVDPSNKANNFEYKMELEDTLMKLETVMDWDMDGEKDDEYIIVHRKTK